jgi:hypothetical protein
VTTGAAGGSATLEQPNSVVVAPAALAARKERRDSDMTDSPGRQRGGCATAAQQDVACGVIAA